jgi:carboxymethylenebutenolidase
MSRHLPVGLPGNPENRYQSSRHRQKTDAFMAIRTQDINGPGLHGYLAQPDGARGGVLLLPTIFAVDAFARAYAQALAEAGLTAAVWDPYSGLPLMTDVEVCRARAYTLSDIAVAGMLTSWVDHMLGHLRLNAIGVLGFCLGGRYAILHAAQDKRIKVCAAAYPSIQHPRRPNQEQDALALAAAIDCPVHLVEPGHDHVSSKETYCKLKKVLNDRRAPTIVQYHPAAEHGFMHRKEPQANRTAAALASPQVIAFLKACLT